MTRTPGEVQGIAFTVLGVALFGASPVLLILAAVPGVVAGVYRLGIPLVVYALIAAFFRGFVIPRRPLFFALAAGSAFGLNIGLFYSAIAKIGPALPSFLSTTSVIWVGLYWMLVANQKVPGRFWVGVISSLIGTAGLFNLGGTVAVDVLGFGLALGAAAAYAGFVIISGVGCRQLGLPQFLFYSHLAGTMTLAALATFSDVSVIVRSGRSLIALLAIGVLSQLCGIAAVTLGQRALTAPRVSAILATEPLFTLALAATFLGTTVTWVQLMGCLLLFGGAALANYALGSKSALGVTVLS